MIYNRHLTQCLSFVFVVGFFGLGIQVEAAPIPRAVSTTPPAIFSALKVLIPVLAGVLFVGGVGRAIYLNRGGFSPYSSSRSQPVVRLPTSLPARTLNRSSNTRDVPTLPSYLPPLSTGQPVRITPYTLSSSSPRAEDPTDLNINGNNNNNGNGNDSSLPTVMDLPTYPDAAITHQHHHSSPSSSPRIISSPSTRGVGSTLTRREEHVDSNVSAHENEPLPAWSAYDFTSPNGFSPSNHLAQAHAQAQGDISILTSHGRDYDLHNRNRNPLSVLDVPPPMYTENIRY